MTKYHDDTYLKLLSDVLNTGVQKGDRTGTGTISIFGPQMNFDISGMSIPMLTTKKMHVRSIIHEILWYLQGNTNIKYLNDNNVRIWNEWADENGDLGPVYGAQWRRWPKYIGSEIDYSTDPPSISEKFEYIDQIANVIETLKTNPNDRRLIVSAWNVGQLNEMKLPPCHSYFQFWSKNNKLKCKLFQRSADTLLGIPFNIVQYSILTHMIAQVVGMEATEFIWTGGDVHLYNNHLEQAKLQLTRKPYPSPTLKLNPNVKEIDDFKYEDFEIVGYESHPTIKAKVSV